MTTTVSCPKCEGHGSIAMYGHVANGVCFLCNGKGMIVAKAERKARKEQTPERKAELAAIKAEKILAGTIDDSIKWAISEMNYKSSFKAEISVLLAQFIRVASAANVTLYEARIADDLMSKAIYRLGK